MAPTLIPSSDFHQDSNSAASMGDTEFWLRERSYLRRRDGGRWIFTSQVCTCRMSDVTVADKPLQISTTSSRRPWSRSTRTSSRRQMARSIVRSENISESGIGTRKCDGGLVCRAMGRGVSSRSPVIAILRQPSTTCWIFPASGAGCELVR